MAILTKQQLRDFRVPQGAMTLWWLGQAGFIVKSPGGTIIAIDPYLSNSCKLIGEQIGFDLDRMTPPPLDARDLACVDAYAITHSHQDHLDPLTLEAYRAAGGTGPYVAPAEAVERLQALGAPADQTVMIWPNKCIAVGDMTLRATFAIPLGGDDLTHVGYLVAVQNGPTAYFTGDTGYHELLGRSVREHKPDILATVINGMFRNLSPAEAAQLAQDIDPKVVLPCHYDLFPDNQQPPHMLRANLRMLGIGERYRQLEHGRAFTYPE